MHIKESKCIIVLDIGGTSVKSTLIDLVDLDSSIARDYFQQIPIDSQGSGEEIIEALVQTVENLLGTARNLRLKVVGIGISMPGPFDYKKGISLMRHKFSALYKVNLKQELIQRLGLKENFPIRFEVDTWAFLIGESWRGSARGYSYVIGITLGAGVGIAFMINNQIVTQGIGVPPNAEIWCLPYKDGIVEDKISRRSILTRYRELKGECSKDFDVKEIFSQAQYGDEISLQVFKELGLTLGKILRPIVLEFKAECLVFGGQISKSFPLFVEPLKKELQFIPHLRKITSADLMDLSAFYGIAKAVIKAQK